MNCSRLPDVNVEDGKGGGDRPGVDEFTSTADTGVGEDAVRARFDPLFNVRTQLGPVEAEADAV